MHLKRAAAILCFCAQLSGTGAFAAEIPKEISKINAEIPADTSIDNGLKDITTEESVETMDGASKTETTEPAITDETTVYENIESLPNTPEYKFDDSSDIVDQTDAKLEELLKEYYSEGESYTTPEYNFEKETADRSGKAPSESYNSLGIPLMRASQITVMKSPHTITVAGQKAFPQKYLINGNNYFKLRDIAYMLSYYSVTPFNVEWDKETGAVNIVTGCRYIMEGGEMAAFYPENPAVLPSSAKLLLNGNPVEAKGYLINGNNYYRIADIAQIVGFLVSYDNNTRTVNISAKVVAENPEKPTTPNTSTTPAAPSTPTTPETPTTPTTPTTPETPTTPTTPTTPPTPTTPETPTTPPTPITPETPTTPPTPITPETPTTPTTPITPATPTTPSTTFSPGIYRADVKTFLNVRSGPGITFNEVGKLFNGEQVTIESVSDGWGHIKDGGYCDISYLTRLSDYTVDTPPLTPDPEYPKSRTEHIDGKMMVVIDAGHGGSDAGAGSDITGLYEKYVNYYVSLYLKQYLEAEGVEVELVRESAEEGADLHSRGDAMDRYLDKVDLFFSIHHNAADTTARGAQVLCQVADEFGGPTKRLAEELGEEYAKLGLYVRDPWFRRGTKDPTSDYYYICNQAAKRDIVAVISEFCFIDNIEDSMFIDSEEDWQAEARAQCNAILRYLNQTKY